jgi:hypothetical protein
MTDAIGIFLPGASVSREKLEKLWVSVDGQRFSGLLRNLRIKQKTTGVWIEGSLPCYFKGTNVLPLSRQELNDALGELEADLELPLATGFVRKQELATTLSVVRPPRDYLSEWGMLPRYKKNTYDNSKTVAFWNSNRSFYGYDKGGEISPNLLPASFEGRYGLRLELRWKHDLKHVYGHAINPWDLMDQDVYRRGVRAWSKLYYLIPKQRQIRIGIDGMTAKGLEDALAAIGLKSIRPDRLEAIIQDGSRGGKVKRTTASRMRDLVRKLGQDKNISDFTPLAKEVDELVRSIENSV